MIVLSSNSTKYEHTGVNPIGACPGLNMQIRQLSKHLRSQEMMVFLTRAPVTTENVTEIYFGESISLFSCDKFFPRVLIDYERIV